MPPRAPDGTVQVPTQLRTMEALPRNAMGKVNKKDLLKVFLP